MYSEPFDITVDAPATSAPFSMSVVEAVEPPDNVVFDSSDMKIVVTDEAATIERKLLNQGVDTIVKRIKDVGSHTQ